MREIKFRVWNKEINKMWDFKTMERSKVFALLPDLPSKDFLVIPNSQEHTLMQYTGLKDKNGTEIYEGDVVKDCDTGTIKTVLWRKSCFVLRDTKGFYQWTYYENEHEVIGNIHNGELLGGAK